MRDIADYGTRVFKLLQGEEFAICGRPGFWLELVYPPELTEEECDMIDSVIQEVSRRVIDDAKEQAST